MRAFVGRDRELAVLNALVQRAAREGPARAVIAAPLGYGISRLLDEFAARTAKAEVLVCRGQCREPRSGVPYAALSEALTPVLAKLSERRLVEVVGPAGYDTVAVMPDLAKRLESARIACDPPALDSPRQRGARVREALIGVLERLAGDRVLCLIIEDIEHSDPGTRELLGSLLGTSHRLALALVVAVHPREISRSHPARSFLQQLDQALDLDRIDLGPLTGDEIAALAEAALEDKPTLAFLAALKEGSGGSPLLAEQLIASQQELETARLSDPLEQTVDARVAQLDRQQVRILRVLAAARRALSASELTAISLSDGHLPRNAAGLVAGSGLVRERDGGVEIAHQLLAEAIEEGMLPTQRHAVHGALAGMFGESPAEKAWHLDRAARPASARAAHIAAADVAQRLEPGTTALMHMVAALEQVADGSDADEVDLLAAAATAADAAGAFRRAATFCAQAIERVAGGRVERLTTPRADAAARARAAALCRELGGYKRSSGDTAGAREAFEQAVAVAPAEPQARAAALAALAQQLMLEGDFAASAVQAEEARRVAAQGGDSALAELAHATDTLAVDVGYSGDIDRALELLDVALGAARRAGDLDEVMRCYANKTTLLDLDLRREQALAVVKEGIGEAARNGLGLTYGAFLGGNAADILFELGRWTEAEAECRAAMEFPPAGVAWFSPILYLGLVVVEARADDEAAQLVGRTLLQLETVPAGQWSSLVLRTAVSLALWRGDPSDALNAADQGWQRVLETDDPVQIVVGAATVLEACAEAADSGRIKRDWSIVAAASALANEVLPVAEQSVARHPLPRTVGARREVDVYLATARAHSERVRGRDRPETWAALADAWAQIPVPYHVAKARWWQCQSVLPVRARRAEARRALREAWAIAKSLPADPLRAALRDLAQRGRISLPAEDLVAIPIEPDESELVAVGPGPAVGAPLGHSQPPELARFGLSPREYGVLLVLAEGRTNREIAERLFISERTVAVHVRRILAKLGVSGRVEAAGVAIRLGLVPEDPRLRQPVSVR